MSFKLDLADRVLTMQEGKSTLMNFILEHLRTQNALEQWAGNDQLVIAKYFFWNAGSDLQMSQEGMLRTVLYDIFSSSLDMSCLTLPKFIDVQRSLTEKYLLQKLEDLLSQDYMSFKLCIFLDGLDELHGDHHKLASWTTRLSRNYTDLKLVVSSRPWPQFERAYAQVPQLLHQDLTRNDIRKYI